MLRSSYLRLAALLAVLISGCATASISHDLRYVHESTQVSERPVVELDSPPPSVASLPTDSPVDADEAVRIAILNNSRLRAELYALGVARGQLIDSRRPPNPTLEIELQPERETAYELRAEYELSALVLTPLRAKVARAKLDRTRHEVAAEVRRLGLAVRTAVYDLQAAQQRLSLVRQWLKVSAASWETATALHAAGNLTSLDVSRYAPPTALCLDLGFRPVLVVRNSSRERPHSPPGRGQNRRHRGRSGRSAGPSLSPIGSALSASRAAQQ